MLPSLYIYHCIQEKATGFDYWELDLNNTVRSEEKVKQQNCSAAC